MCIRDRINIEQSKYVAKENNSLVINKDEVNKNIVNKKIQLIYALYFIFKFS